MNCPHCRKIIKPKDIKEPPYTKEEYWTMANGEEIAVGDMDIKHLRNSLRCVIRMRENERYDDEDLSELTGIAGYEGGLFYK